MKLLAGIPVCFHILLCMDYQALFVVVLTMICAETAILGKLEVFHVQLNSNWFHLSTGDEVLFTSTDYDWKQAETRLIVECGQYCSSRQIKVDGTYSYTW